jgi:hypothetical protein
MMALGFGAARLLLLLQHNDCVHTRFSTQYSHRLMERHSSTCEFSQLANLLMVHNRQSSITQSNTKMFADY